MPNLRWTYRHPASGLSPLDIAFLSFTIPQHHKLCCNKQILDSNPRPVISTTLTSPQMINQLRLGYPISNLIKSSSCSHAGIPHILASGNRISEKYTNWTNDKSDGRKGIYGKAVRLLSFISLTLERCSMPITKYAAIVCLGSPLRVTIHR